MFLIFRYLEPFTVGCPFHEPQLYPKTFQLAVTLVRQHSSLRKSTANSATYPFLTHLFYGLPAYIFSLSYSFFNLHISLDQNSSYKTNVLSKITF